MLSLSLIVIFAFCGLYQVCTVNVFATVFFGNNFEFSFKGFAEPLNLEFDLTDYEGNF